VGGIPSSNSSFLDECIPMKAINGQKRWRSKDAKKIYTWDSLHGEIEIFNNRGRHLGVLNPEGDLIKDAIKGRTIYV
jgi:hypothetical protein